MIGGYARLRASVILRGANPFEGEPARGLCKRASSCHAHACERVIALTSSFRCTSGCGYRL
eukprot:scaffold200346_cov36-Tisochrysis_lutea.AAC.2